MIQLAQNQKFSQTPLGQQIVLYQALTQALAFRSAAMNSKVHKFPPLIALLLLLLAPCASPLSSASPFELEIESVRFHPPTPENPFASQDPRPAMAAHVKLPNILPYIVEQGKESFIPICESVLARADCTKVYCPPTGACVSRIEVRASLSWRTSQVVPTTTASTTIGVVTEWRLSN